MADLLAAGATRLGVLYVESTDDSDWAADQIARRAAEYGATHWAIMRTESSRESAQIWPGQSYTRGSATVIGGSVYGSATTTYTPPINYTYNRNYYRIELLYAPKGASTLDWSEWREWVKTLR